MQPISLGGPFLFCVIIITVPSMLTGKVFAVRHSPYAASKVEFNRPNKHRKNGWERFFETNENNNKNMNMKKDDENSRSLNSVYVSHIL